MMKMVKSQARFSADPTKRFQVKEQREALTPARLFVQRTILDGAAEILPAVPWGLLIPGETVIDRGPSAVRIDAKSTPPESTFFLYFQIDGGDRYEQSLIYAGPEPEVGIFLPQEWMSAAMGKNVTLGYHVEWPDGTRLEGPETSFHILLPLEVPPIQIEGVGYGEVIDPAKLPEVINLTIDRVRNLESFHGARLRMIVSGNKNGFTSPVLDYHFPLDDVGEGPHNQRIFRSYLTYPYENGYTDVSVDFLFRSNMLPPPNTQDDWGNHTRIGLNKVLPPS